VVSSTVTSQTHHSSNSSDVFPPVCFLFDGTLIWALVFRNYFIRLSTLGSFNNSSLWRSKCFFFLPVSHFILTICSKEYRLKNEVSLWQNNRITDFNHCLFNVATSMLIPHMQPCLIGNTEWKDDAAIIHQTTLC